MADKTGEQLSALVDGEIDAQEMQLALRRLTKDVDIKTSWQHYHLISDTLKNHLPETVDLDFCDRVSSLIDAEPALTGRDVSRRRNGTVRFAIAASVVLVSVTGLRLWTSTIGTSPIVNSSISIAGNGVDEKPGSQVGEKLEYKDYESSGGNLESLLASYIVSHNELLISSMNSVHGMLPYGRSLVVDSENHR